MTKELIDVQRRGTLSSRAKVSQITRNGLTLESCPQQWGIHYYIIFFFFYLLMDYILLYGR